MAGAREQIESCNNELMAAFSRGDFKKMGLYYTEDCKIMEPGARESVGREGVEAVFKRQKETGAVRVQLTIDEIGSLGPDICFERHGFKTFKADESVLEEGKSLVIWKNVSGKWLAYIDIFNSNA